jgi:hypothetical protein
MANPSHNGEAVGKQLWGKSPHWRCRQRGSRTGGECLMGLWQKKPARRVRKGGRS